MTRNRSPGGESLRFIWNEVIQRHDHRPAAFSGHAVFGTDYWEFQIFRGGKGLSLMGRFGEVKKNGGQVFRDRFHGYMVEWSCRFQGSGLGSHGCVARGIWFPGVLQRILMGSISF